MSDQGAFRKGGVPYLFLSCGRWQHYHTPENTPDRLNYGKMEAITGLVISLLKAMDSLEMDRTGHEQFSDILELERECFRDAFGIFYQPLLRQFGLEDVVTRKDVNIVVNGLMHLGL